MTKVLVVDDSALMRRRLTEILEGAGFVVETAQNGGEALARLPLFDPDVVTLDVTMPEMDGLTCLGRIMVEHPKPVVMVSTLTAEGAGVTIEALRLGAVDAVQKPGAGPVAGIADRLVEAVRTAAVSRPRRVHGLRERLRVARARIAGTDFAASVPAGESAGGLAGGPEPAAPRREAVAGPPQWGVVLIGVSTGGPSTLEEILPQLPAGFPWPVVVAQHMPPAFTATLARRLNEICPLQVVEVGRAMELLPGTIHVARGGADIQLVRRRDRPMVAPVPPLPGKPWHPNVDALVESALPLFPASRIVGVLLTGMGNDGAAAMADLHRCGGRTIAESEDSAVVFGMPRELIERGGAGVVLAADRIAGQLTRWIGTGDRDG